MRKTAFRRANQRRRLVKSLVKPLVIGSCAALLAAGIGILQMDTGAAQGTFEQPHQVEAPKDRNEAKPVSGEEAELEYMGEMEVAAYCRDGASFTYSGEAPVEGRTAAGALSLFKLGDRVLIDGNLYVIEDKVDENAPEKLRIYFDSYGEAMAHGRKTAAVCRRPMVPEQRPGYLGEFEVTAYCSCELCCGVKERRLTKSETVPRAGHTIAVDPSVIPLGTQLVVDGVTYLAEDTGKAIKGKCLDIYFDTHEEAVRYGRKERSVYLKDSYNPLQEGSL